MIKINCKLFQRIAIVVIFGVCISCKCKPNGQKISKSILSDTCNGTNFMKITSQDYFHVDYHNYWINGFSIYANYGNQILKMNSFNSDCNFENTTILVQHNIVKIAVLPNKNMWILQVEDTGSNYKYSMCLTDTLGKIQVKNPIYKCSTIPLIVATTDNGCIVVIPNFEDSLSKLQKVYKSALLRFDANGNIVWQHEYPGRDPYGSFPNGVIVTSSKDIFVYGTTLDKYDKNGNLLWKKNYRCYSMIELPSNTFLISNEDIFKIDNDGAILWEHDIPYNKDLRVINSGDCGFILCYTNYSNQDNSDIFLEKYNSDGQNVWKKSFGGTGDELYHALFYLPLKGYYILGVSKNYTGNSSIIDDSSDRCSKWWRNSSETSNYFIKTDLNGNTCN